MAIAQRLKETSGVESEIGPVVLIRVERVAPILSPVYDSGRSEAEVRAIWLGRSRDRYAL